MSRRCRLTVCSQLNKGSVTLSKESLDGLRSAKLSIRDSSSIELVVYLKDPCLNVWIFDDKDRKSVEKLAIVIHLHCRRKSLNA